MPYRVDNIPLLIRPFYLAISWIMAVFLRLIWGSIRISCSIEYKGEKNLEGHNGVIYCFWHDQLSFYFMVFNKVREKQIWLNHPLWFMKPIHYSLNFMGVEKLALGSSGNSGKEALQEVVEHLKEGYSTVINPDGPRGPVKVIKPGVLIMAAKTGLPIIPVKFRASREFILNTWEKKRNAVPFSKVTVEYGKPIFVKEGEIDQKTPILQKALGD